MKKIYTQKEIDKLESDNDPILNSLWYKNRPGIRRSGINVRITDCEMVTLYEYDRNPISFIHEYGIVYTGGNRCRPVLHPHQERIMIDHETERFYPMFSERQSGLSSSIQFMALHDLVFKGTDIVICCTRMERSADIIGRIMEMYSELPFYMKPGVESMEEVSVRFENGGRITAWPPGRIVGRNIGALFIDDFQYMDRKNIESILNNWLPAMMSITSTKVFIGCSGSVPTSLRDNEFFRIFSLREIEWVKVK